MTKVVKGARFISKISNVIGTQAAVPPNDDHTLGWNDNQIYIGEWFFNAADSKIYYRHNNGIGQIVQLDSSKKIPIEYLPDTLGYLIYKGTWDARTVSQGGTGLPPGYPNTPLKGHYYIVSVSGSTNLDGITDWRIGDYAVYDGTSWDKIDNSEPIIYANNVLYNNTTYTGITNVDDALEKIYNEKFINPYFDETVVIENYESGKTLLRLNGDANGIDTAKFIDFNGEYLNFGSYDNNTSVEIRSKSGTGSKYSVFSIRRVDSSNTIRQGTQFISSDFYNRFMMWDTAGNRVIDLNTDDYGYFNIGNIGIGVASGDTVNAKLDVRGDTNIGDLSGTTLYDRTLRILSSDPYESSIDMYGTSEGSGNVFFGKNILYGGGIIYAGTNANHFINGNISDKISFYRRNNGYEEVVFYYNNNDNNVTFRNNINVNNELYVTNRILSNGDIDVVNDLTVSGSTKLYTKAAYNDYSTVNITNLNDITHKAYVDEQITLRGVGHWLSGITFNSTTQQVVAYDLTATKYVGINTNNPSYNLEVIGNAYIDDILNVDEISSPSGTLTINNEVQLSDGSTSDEAKLFAVKFSSLPVDLGLYAGSAIGGSPNSGGTVYINGGFGELRGGDVNISGGLPAGGGVAGDVYITGAKGNAPSYITGNVYIGSGKSKVGFSTSIYDTVSNEIHIDSINDTIITSHSGETIIKYSNENDENCLRIGPFYSVIDLQSSYQFILGNYGLFADPTGISINHNSNNIDLYARSQTQTLLFLDASANTLELGGTNTLLLSPNTNTVNIGNSTLITNNSSVTINNLNNDIDFIVKSQTQTLINLNAGTNSLVLGSNSSLIIDNSTVRLNNLSNNVDFIVKSQTQTLINLDASANTLELGGTNTLLLSPNTNTVNIGNSTLTINSSTNTVSTNNLSIVNSGIYFDSTVNKNIQMNTTTSAISSTLSILGTNNTGYATGTTTTLLPPTSTTTTTYSYAVGYNGGDINIKAGKGADVPDLSGLDSAGNGGDLILSAGDRGDAITGGSDGEIGNVSITGRVVDIESDLIDVGWYIRHRGDTDTSIEFTNNTIGFKAGEPTFDKMTILSNSVIINDFSQDYDFIVESNNNTQMLFVDAGIDCVSIAGVGNASYELYVNGNGYATGAWTDSSDIRFKENIKQIENPLNKVMNITGYTFNKTNIESDKNFIGFIAQEINEFLPEVVSIDDDGYYGISYGNVSALLLEAMKEQQTIINELKNEIELLKNKN